MEEDTGKSTHVGGATGRIHGAEYSLVDYNRAGVPLVEIVTKPIDGAGGQGRRGGPRVRQPAPRLIVRAGRLRGRMDQGNLRVRRQRVADAARAPTVLGTRTETKNVNSFRSVERAVRYEISGRRRCSTPAARSCRRPGTGTRTPAVTTPRPREVATPTTTATSPSPTWSRSRRRASGSRSSRRRCPRHPSVRRIRLQEEWGFTDLEMRDVVDGGALELIVETVERGRDAAGRPQVVDGRARPRGERRRAWSSTSSRVDARPRSPRCRRWSTTARSTTSSPARCSTGCSRARARRPRSSRSAGSRWSRTTGH